jgi:hypothetical protein
MRADMAKVIVERPRYGSRSKGAGKGYRRRQQRCAWEEMPHREKLKERSGGTKRLNEHLGPLARFLQSRVGQPWNRIFSEICAHIDRNSAVQDHVRDHLADFVAVKVILIDGQPCQAEGQGYGQPLTRGRFRPRLYVCPRTGLLKRVTKGRSSWWRQRNEQAVAPACVKVDATHQYCRISGVWYLVTLQRFPITREEWLGAGPVKTQFDVALKRDLTRAEAVQIYGAAVHAVAKRRLSRREIWRYCTPARSPR